MGPGKAPAQRNSRLNALKDTPALLPPAMIQRRYKKIQSQVHTTETRITIVHTCSRADLALLLACNSFSNPEQPPHAGHQRGPHDRAKERPHVRSREELVGRGGAEKEQTKRGCGTVGAVRWWW